MKQQLTRSEATAAALKALPLAKAAGFTGDTTMNREEWLTRVANLEVCPLIAIHNGVVPTKYRVSVGWPRGSRGGKTSESIGQCWDPKCSSDGHSELFISPKLDAYAAVETLIHEMIYVSAGVAAKHRGEFKRLAVAVGLEGKMTATLAGEELGKRIRAWIADMPEYPHGPMDVAGGKDGAPEEKKGSRLIKVCCISCEYTVRMSQKWIDVAVPCCPNKECDVYGDELAAQS